MIHIDMSIDGSDVLIMLKGLEQSLQNFQPAWPRVEGVIINMLKKRFQSEGAYPQEQWAPLSPSYAKWKRSHYGNKGMLRLQDRLYGSLTEVDHSEHVFRSGPDWMETGTATPHGIYHQRGTSTMPQRKIFTEISKAEGENITDVILAYIIGEVRRGLR